MIDNKYVFKCNTTYCPINKVEIYSKKELNQFYAISKLCPLCGEEMFKI